MKELSEERRKLLVFRGLEWCFEGVKEGREIRALLE